MSVPDDDFAERSRSIFERLRAAQAEPQEATDERMPVVDGQASEAPTPSPVEVPPEGDDGEETATDAHQHAAGGQGADVAQSAPEQAAVAHAADESPSGDEAGVVFEASPVEIGNSSPELDDLGPSMEAVAGLGSHEQHWPESSSVVDAGETAETEMAAEAGDIPAEETEPAAEIAGQGFEAPQPNDGERAAPAENQYVAPTRPEAPPPSDGERTAPAEDQYVAPTRPEAPPAGDVSVEEPPPPAKLGADLDPLRFVRPLPRVIAVANQKGGVGKTTTTVNLGASLAVLGYRVLVIDLDPQGNATTGLGINSRNLDCSIYDVILHDTPLEDCIEPTTLRNLFVAPATIDLAGAEIELVPAFSREQRLRKALADVKDDYEFVLIDCPPSLGLLTVNALSAATEVIVPIQCEYYALEGLGQLLRNVNLVQANLNPTLELSAIVLTMYDARTKLAEQVADEVRQHFGERVCRNVVPRTVRLSEAPSFGQPIIVFDPSSRGALAYRELAKEVSGGAPQRTG